MSIDILSLRKILELEKKRGFSDKAVIGGLDKFMRNWTSTAVGSITSRGTLSYFRVLHLSNPGYSKMDTQQRQEWVKDILLLMNKLQDNEPVKPIKRLKQTVAKNAIKSTVVKKSGFSVIKSLDAPITVIKGLGANLAPKFIKLGVKSVRDILYFFPSRHVDYSQLKTVSQLVEGTEETIIGNVWEAQVSYPGGRKSSEAIVGDATGNVRVVWFNNPYIARMLKPNMRVVLSGRVRVFNGRFVFESPEWEPAEEGSLIHTGRLVPVYPLTEGLSQRVVRRLVKSTVDKWTDLVTDFLPEDIQRNCDLLALPKAILQAHYPDNRVLFDKARIRLAFDELFLLQLGVLSRKRSWRESQPGNPIETDKQILNNFIKSLPFKLTIAQERVLNQILLDMAKAQAMSRLLQGEVGSGKTVVATAALLTAVARGFQTTLMAPTEILTEQHFTTIQRLLSRNGVLEEQTDYLYSYSGILPRTITIALLIGALPLKKKRHIQHLVNENKIDIVIGTHALIQEEVEFKRLGFVVVDEQHRFGVEQRGSLRQKGTNPHVLVMTATPIPRTLALTLYGDLDISVIDELPQGRKAIKTRWLRPNQRESAYRFIRREIADGHQAFIICPLIEESEAVQARAATAEYEKLAQEVFPDLQLGLLHGRMSSTDKEKVMRRFHDGTLNILVSTPVVEVGIDVPNATVMMVESADRFGLAQLHQFRGRIGRGVAQSYCILLAENPSVVGQERLKIIENTFDGFKLAEEDLKLRGPGEFFGTRQSGLPDLKMAKLTDVAILELARKEAEKFFDTDPHLTKPENGLLVKELTRVWTSEVKEWS